MFVRPLPLLTFEQSCAEHDTVAAIVQFERKYQNVPAPSRGRGGQVRDASLSAAVDIGFAGIGYGANDFAEFVFQFRILLKKILSRKPIAFALAERGKIVVDVLPVAVRSIISSATSSPIAMLMRE